MYKNVNVTIPIKRELMMNFIEKVPVPRPLPRPWIISSFVLRCICVCIDLQHAPTDNFTTADWLIYAQRMSLHIISSHF